MSVGTGDHGRLDKGVRAVPWADRVPRLCHAERSRDDREAIVTAESKHPYGHHDGLSVPLPSLKAAEANSGGVLRAGMFRLGTGFALRSPFFAQHDRSKVRGAGRLHRKLEIVTLGGANLIP